MKFEDDMEAKARFREKERKREYREEIRNRIKDSNTKLPSFARVTTAGKISCFICHCECTDSISFKHHMKERKHVNAVNELKDEIEVQREVNLHVLKLLKPHPDAEMESGGVHRSTQEHPLGKRPSDTTLVLEERVIPVLKNEELQKPKLNTLLQKAILPETNSALNQALPKSQTQSDSIVNELTSNDPPIVASTPKPSVLDSMKSNQSVQEDRLKSKLAAMKDRIKQAKQ